MDAAASADPPGIGAGEAGDRPRSPAEASDDSWLVRLERMLDQLRASLSTRAELAALEAHRAVHLCLTALIMAALGALLAVTAWFALVAGLIVWAVHAGLALHWALIIVALGSVVVAVLALRMGRGAISRISFEATWRTLRRPPVDDPNAASSGGK